MFYVFHGDDTHSQLQTLADLVSKLGDPAMLDLNTTRLEGSFTLGELRHACDSIPFLAEKRIVIVNGMFASTPAKSFMQELLDYLPHLPETTRLFFLEAKKLPGNNRLVRLAEKSANGFVRQFDRPVGGEIDRWIRNRVREKGGEIAPQAANMLAANIGNDLQVLDNEIEKLLLFCGSGEVIRPADVTLLCPYVAEANIFDLVDALGSRNGRLAAQLLQAKAMEGADPFYLFSMVVRQFRLLIQVKELAGQGLRPPAIAKEAKLHSFVVGKLYQQSQHFSISQLEQIYAHLLEMDVGVKTGRTDMATALDLLMAGLTT